MPYAIVAALILGGGLTAFGIEFVKLQNEVMELRRQNYEATKLADEVSQQAQQCANDLLFCKHVQQSDVEKAQIVLFTKYQTIELIKAAQKGDRQAKQKLDSFDWVPEPLLRRTVEHHPE